MFESPLLCGRAVSVSLLLVAFSAVAQTPAPGVTATELVRQTMAHELAAANASGHYMYRIEKQTQHGSTIRDTVETRKWLISRLVLKNGQPMAPAQRQKEDERLRDLLTNPASLQKLQIQEHKDEALARRMIKYFPEAFVFYYDGTEKESSSRKQILVKFRPRASVTSDSREMRVLQGMEGTMLIDPVDERLLRVKAALFRDVDFGWGVFCRIRRGGSFLVEQQGVGSDRWAITTLSMHYSSRIGLFVNTRTDSVSKASNFRRMSNDLTLQQGLELLLNPKPQL
jgi:hypothetical protein